MKMQGWIQKEKFLVENQELTVSNFLDPSDMNLCFKHKLVNDTKHKWVQTKASQHRSITASSDFFSKVSSMWREKIGSLAL